MRVIKPVMEGDFSEYMLNDALQLIEKEMCDKIGWCRLIISNGYRHNDILEAIFTTRGKLDIPFEVCYAFPIDMWMLVGEMQETVGGSDFVYISPGA